MKLGIKMIWTKVESEGGLYQSDLKIKIREKEVEPNGLLYSLNNLKLNDILYLERNVSEDGDFYIVVTNGTTYTSEKIYLSNYRELGSRILERNIKDIKRFFKEIKKEFKKATTNLKSETLVFEF